MKSDGGVLIYEDEEESLLALIRNIRAVSGALPITAARNPLRSPVEIPSDWDLDGPEEEELCQKLRQLLRRPQGVPDKSVLAAAIRAAGLLVVDLRMPADLSVLHENGECDSGACTEGMEGLHVLQEAQREGRLGDCFVNSRYVSSERPEILPEGVHRQLGMMSAGGLRSYSKTGEAIDKKLALALRVLERGFALPCPQRGGFERAIEGWGAILLLGGVGAEPEELADVAHEHGGWILRDELGHTARAHKLVVDGPADCESVLTQMQNGAASEREGWTVFCPDVDRGDDELRRAMGRLLRERLKQGARRVKMSVICSAESLEGARKALGADIVGLMEVLHVPTPGRKELAALVGAILRERGATWTDEERRTLVDGLDGVATTGVPRRRLRVLMERVMMAYEKPDGRLAMSRLALLQQLCNEFLSSEVAVDGEEQSRVRARADKETSSSEPNSSGLSVVESVNECLKRAGLEEHGGRWNGSGAEGTLKELWPSVRIEFDENSFPIGKATLTGYAEWCETGEENGGRRRFGKLSTMPRDWPAEVRLLAWILRTLGRDAAKKLYAAKKKWVDDWASLLGGTRAKDGVS